MQVGIYLPCYDLFRNWLEDLTAQNIPGATPYVPLVAGSLARSLACATCYPIELARTRMQVEKMISYIYTVCFILGMNPSIRCIFIHLLHTSSTVMEGCYKYADSKLPKLQLIVN